VSLILSSPDPAISLVNTFGGQAKLYKSDREAITHKLILDKVSVLKIKESIAVLKNTQQYHLFTR
jgi:hypothetical protein